MKIKTSAHLHALESAVNQCSRSVWLESVRGEHYDLKDDLQRVQGIARLLQDPDGDLELFVSAREDEGIMMELLSKLPA